MENTPRKYHNELLSDVLSTILHFSIFLPLLTADCLFSSSLCPLCLRQTVKATSPLGDPRVTYNLEEGQVPETNMPVRFYIKPNRADGSASILVAENLDYETTRFFTLRVRVQNVAAVPLASFSTVYVNVTGEMGGGCRIWTPTVYINSYCIYIKWCGTCSMWFSSYFCGA